MEGEDDIYAMLCVLDVVIKQIVIEVCFKIKLLSEMSLWTTVLQYYLVIRLF